MTLLIQPLYRDSSHQRITVGDQSTVRFGAMNQMLRLTQPIWSGMTDIGGQYVGVDFTCIKLIHDEPSSAHPLLAQHWCACFDDQLYPYRTHVTTPWINRSWCYPQSINVIRKLMHTNSDFQSSVYDVAHLMLMSARLSEHPRVQDVADVVNDDLTELPIDSSQCVTDSYHVSDVYKQMHDYALGFAHLLNDDASTMSFVQQHYGPAVSQAGRKIVSAGIHAIPQSLKAVSHVATNVVTDAMSLRCEHDQLSGWRTHRGEILSVISGLPVKAARLMYHCNATGATAHHIPIDGCIHWLLGSESESVRSSVVFSLGNLVTLFYTIWLENYPTHPVIRLDVHLSSGDELMIAVQSVDGCENFGAYYIDLAREYLAPMNLGVLPV